MGTLHSRTECGSPFHLVKVILMLHVASAGFTICESVSQSAPAPAREREALYIIYVH